MNDRPEVIRIEEVRVRHGDVPVLDGVSLVVREGEFAAVIGPNGAGKTTLVKVVLGLLRPDSGRVEVFGKPVRELGPERARIGYVPQMLAQDIHFPISVYETVLMGVYGRVGLARRPGARDRELALNALAKVGLSDLKDRPIGRLSSGQRQRVFVARALADNPSLLLLDEPTTGVDATTTDSLYTLLKQLKEEGVTTVLVSHDVGVVAAYADTLVCLNRVLVAHGRPEEVAAGDALARMYGCDAAYLHHGNAPHIVVEDH